jgi:uncharacterized membrane-anchored protein
MVSSFAGRTAAERVNFIMSQLNQTLLSRAQAAGIISTQTPVQTQPNDAVPATSWFVIAMGFVGAMLATTPFLIIFFINFHSQLEKSPALGLTLGFTGLGAAFFLWRYVWEKITPHASPYGFIVQLGLMLAIAGIGIMVLGNVDSLFIAFIALWLATQINLPWIQQLAGFVLGLALANLAVLGYSSYAVQVWPDFPMPAILAYAPSLLAVCWALWVSYESRISGRCGSLPWVERVSRIADAIAAAVLATLAYHSSVLIQKVFHERAVAQGSADSLEWGTAALWQISPISGLHAIAVMLLGVYLARCWGLLERTDTTDAKAARTKKFVLSLIAIAYGSWALLTYVSFGSAMVCLLATLALTTQRKRLFTLAMLVLLAQLTGFYYVLEWTLLQKAGLLLAVGAGIGLATFLAYALWGRSHTMQEKVINDALKNELAPSTTIGLKARRYSVAIALGAALALGAINDDVYKKEQIITQGQKIYIRLLPKDPRSIMQGDYMALNFGMPSDLLHDEVADIDRLQNDVFVFAELDARGVAYLLNTEDAKIPATAPRIRLPLKYKNGGWVLVTDAFFFPEGQGAPFEKAAFGEFRSLPDGRALLVGLADSELRSITPASKPKNTTPK